MESGRDGVLWASQQKYYRDAGLVGGLNRRPPGHEKPPGRGTCPGPAAWRSGSSRGPYPDGADLWFDTFAGPWIVANAPTLADNPNRALMQCAFASYVLFAAGWTLFGVSMMRARVYPIVLWATVALGGLVGFFALMPPYAIPLGGALLALGIWIVRYEYLPARQAAGAVRA